MIAVWSRTCGAVHIPHTHHQATRGDITIRSAAAPHSAKHAPPLERSRLCVVLLAQRGLVLLFNSTFARARSRDVAKGALAVERWPKNRELRKRGVVSC